MQGFYESLVDALSKLRLDSAEGCSSSTAEARPSKQQREGPAIRSLVPSAHGVIHQQCPFVGMVSVPIPAAGLVHERGQAEAAGALSPVSAARERRSGSALSAPAGSTAADTNATSEAASHQAISGSAADLTASLSQDGGAVVLQNPDGTTALVLLTSDAARRTQAQQAALRQHYGCCVDLSTYEVQKGLHVFSTIPQYLL